MKTRILCTLSIMLLIMGCSQEEVNETSTQKTAPSIMLNENELDAPFRSYSYQETGEGVYTVNFEVPENYSYTINLVNSTYVVNLSNKNTSDSRIFINHQEEFRMINRRLKVEFKVNAVAIRKPSVVINE